MILILAYILTASAALVGASPAYSQVADPLGAHSEWRTQHTRFFSVHYPVEASAWTGQVAARLDSIHHAVGAMVGNVPGQRITVVVADPYNVSNGFAIPLLDMPTMVLWPTPPNPRSSIGEHRGWGEILAVHEFAHLAHLAWPSRNPRDRFLWSLLPARLGPLVRRSPRWVIEGYATYLEGRITGHGRPHGTWRPAILRQWALDGRLPTYGQLSDWGAYQGGAMAYLAGSAYLEWLVEQHGEASLNHLWRRMTAVQQRGFGAAFAGVFGGPPDELYGRFTVELTREALEAERLIEEAGGWVTGEQYQRLGWHTGDPAVSRDGSRIAIVLRARDLPSRVVVWRTDEPADTVGKRQRQQLLERDPLDVLGVEWRPAPKRAVATLVPVAGRGHDEPRFLPDGQHVLVSRPEPLADGRIRPDLFVWDTRGGGLRRVTRGGAVRQADPSPDGERAIGVRCEGGVCSLARVDLASGAVELVLPGSPDTVFYRPRYSPDGGQVAVAVQSAGRWRIALTDEYGRALSYIGPDDGHDRYDPAWTADGSALVVTSHRGGIPNLEQVVLATGEAQTLTRTSSAAIAPEPNPEDGSVFFLHLTSRGLDLNRLPPGAGTLEATLDLAPRLQRTARTRPVVAPDTFPLSALTAVEPYRLGPRRRRVLPAGGTSADGATIVLGAYGSDPVGRLGWSLAGAVGDAGTWRGAGLHVGWRGSRPAVHSAAWWARQRPAGASGGAELDRAALDVDYGGTAIWLDLSRHTTHGVHRTRAGVTAGRMNRLDDTTGANGSAGRHLAFTDLESSFRIGARTLLLPSAGMHLSAGRTAGESWQRAEATTRIAIARGDASLAIQGSHGRLWGGGPEFERFSVGGATQLLFDPLLLPQRHSLPGVPVGTLQGTRLSAVRVSAAASALAPFAWAGRTNERSGWYRVVGVERGIADGPAPLVRMPRVRALAGVAYPLDEPFRHRLRAYLSVELRP